MCRLRRPAQTHRLFVIYGSGPAKDAATMHEPVKSHHFFYPSSESSNTEMHDVEKRHIFYRCLV